MDMNMGLQKHVYALWIKSRQPVATDGKIKIPAVGIYWPFPSAGNLTIPVIM